jgi:hypothetical protein
MVKDEPRAVQLEAPAFDLAALEAQIKEDVYWLADPAREGRGLGTDGIEVSADYIADRFETLGLEPGGDDGTFFQNFPLDIGSELVPEQTRLAVGGTELVLDEDYTPMGVSSPAAFDAPVVFAGYGINSDDYNDFDAVDVEGKVALILRYEPHDADGDSRLGRNGNSSRNAALTSKIFACQRAGAAAVLIVNPPRFHDDTPPLMGFGSAPRRGRITIPAFHITQEAAHKILDAAGLPELAELQDRIDSIGEPIAVEPANEVNVAGDFAAKTNTTTVRNVVAVLPGAGENADEYVAIGGHYDHLGFGGFGSRSPGVEAVHYGADDNASGTAAVMALAEHFAEQPTDRSLVFILFSAEEVGLIGSRHWVENATVPIEEVVAMFNYDMLGRPEDDTLEVGGHLTAAELEPLTEAATAAYDLEWESMGGGMDGRSDHANFWRADIPAMFFFGSIHEEYHTPDDTPDKVNYPFLATATAATSQIIREVANAPERPVFIDPSREANAAGAAGEPSDEQPPARRVRLGILPDMTAYGGDENPSGVVVDGVSNDTPAAKAGLQTGDVITAIGQMEIADIYDLQEALAAAEPGSTMPVKVRRDGTPQELSVTFEATNDQ